jgi:hypothetical protein
MTHQRMKTTLEEDFQALNISISADNSAKMYGIINEDTDNTEKIKSEEKDDDLKKGQDPFDGEYVTNELFNRIEALQLEDLEEEDIQKILDGLAGKKIPDGDDDILERAEKIIAALQEGKATRQRRFKAGSTARKLSFQCPPGMRAVSKDGGVPICRPSHVVAGGMGKLAKEGRKKKKWRRGGKGVVSQMRSARAEKRRVGLRKEDTISPFVEELLQISEDISTSGTRSVRDEIIERIVNIVDLLNEEFMDGTISDIYTEAVNSVIDTYEAGRLEEDVMDDDEFIAELNPILTIISKSINRLDDGEMGND